MITQTAVEWLEAQLTYQHEGQTLNKFYDWKDISEIYNQAKEMEKEQVINAYKNGQKIAEQYYKEKYNI
jgi:hypothetical protein